MNLTQTTFFYCTESFDEFLKIEFLGQFYGPKKSLKKPLKLDIAECQSICFSVIALLVLIFQQFKQSYFFLPHPVYVINL
jgi:hypothetical protein